MLIFTERKQFFTLNNKHVTGIDETPRIKKRYIVGFPKELYFVGAISYHYC